MSNLVEHAKRELELMGKDDPWFDEGCVKVVQAFADMGHSGGSAAAAIPIINALLQFKNLSPLTDNPIEWIHHESEKSDIWQSCRNSEAFSNDGGITYYLLSEGGNDQHREPLHESVKSEVK